MKLIAALKFALWFALCDVWRPASRGATLVCAANVIVLTTAALLGVGTLTGLRNIERQNILRDPLSLCLWVGNPSFSEERQKLVELDELRTRLKDKLGPHFRGCHPFASRELEFEIVGGQSKTGRLVLRRTCAGRTITPDDPYLDSLYKDSRFNALQSNDDDGIFVSAYMLSELGFQKNMPSELSLVATSGLELKIPVRGVLDNQVGAATGRPRRLPPGYDFVISEACLDKLRPRIENSAAQWVELGPIPDDWAAPGKLPAEAKQVFASLNLSRPYHRFNQGLKCWRIASHGSPPPRILEWRLIAQRVAAAMRAADVPLEIKNFERTESAGAASPIEYERAALYVTIPEALEGAADVAEDFGLSIDREIVQQLKRIERNSKSRMVMLLALLSFLAVTSLMNISSIQAMHVQRKIAAIGMLRAIGMSRRLLGTIYILEPLLICCAAFLA
ncbi:MAG TPA: FtsX-like permease family protein, partial [Pirellulales bacterium]